MSAPEHHVEVEPPRKARWLDRLVMALLAVAVATATAALTPALLQAGGVELPVAAKPSADAAPLALPRRPPEIRNDIEEGAPHGQLGLARTAITLHDEPSL